MAAGATYEPIQSYTLASSASSITFNSIAASWTDLRLVFVGTGIAGVYIQLNADSGTSYSSTWMTGNGSTATSSSNVDSSVGINLGDAGFGLSNTVPQMYTVDLFSYAGNTYKTLLASVSSDRNGTGRVGNLVGLWRSTAAITSFKIDANGNTFNAGCIATLYGIKAA